MLFRNLNSPDPSSSLIPELSDGLPTIAAFARLCGHAVAGEIQAVPLSVEALALVAASKPSGIFEIRGSKDGFESTERFLAVCVEIESDQRLLFRDKSNPRRTMQFLEGFRQLCQSGFVFHHLMKDFSLSKSGYELAETLIVDDYREQIEFAIKVEH